jgi:mRNA-degrading endonuclease RelE of RelBE toxin-antitoxin system
MKKIEKLLRKLRKEDRRKLLNIVKKLAGGQIIKLGIKKIRKTDFYRLRHKNFRIIFHYENKKIIIDAIKLKNKNTYENL